MNEISKTVSFILAAGLLGAWATFAYFSTQPREVNGFEKVGEEFFASFTDPSLARSLSVSAYDEKTGTAQSFEVSYSNGLWRIPSHHGYPAEAADRLAKTATSLLGVRRESVVSRRDSEHSKFGVVDPAGDEADSENAGKRITLRDGNGETLADYIIGKPSKPGIDDDLELAVRDANRTSKYFYVRVPDEKETYMAAIDIELSTQFTDWIEPDLLQVDREEINKIEIDSYELVESVVDRQMQFSKRVDGQFRLTRDGFSPWTIEGINETTEELDTKRVDELLDLIDEMNIVGVRPKATIDGKPLVRSDLTVNVELARENPESFQEQMHSLQQDLEDKGFVIGADEKDPDKLMLLATRGELRATTNNGVAYTLFYGNATSGDESEIRINDDAEPGTDSPVDIPDDSVVDDKPLDETTPNPDQKNRFVAIRVDFDQAAMGDVPVEPVKPVAPVQPEGYDSWKAEQEQKLQAPETSNEQPDENAADSAPATAESAADPVADDSPAPPADVVTQTDEKFSEYELAMVAFQQTQLQYTTDLETYDSGKSAYAAREKAGRDLVKELNERFGQWYYVVPSSSLETIKLKRSDLVKVRETPPPPADGPSFPSSDPVPHRPDISLPPQLPPSEPSAVPEPDGSDQ